MLNVIRLPMAVLSGCLLTACGGSGGDSGPPRTGAVVTLTSISIAPAAQTLRIGATRQLTATGNYSDGSTQNLTASVVWTSSAGTAVSNTGLVAAAAIGSSTITATSGATTGTTTVIVSAVSLPKTAQTACYDVATNLSTPCLGTGQDGELQIGVAVPSPRFTVDGTGNCVTDNLTGLMWTRNANLPAGTGAATTGSRTWQQALDFANNLNHCGVGGWRLPNRKELRSLINYSTASSANLLNAPAGLFTGVQAYDYWSSTTSAAAGVTANAVVVNMHNGGMGPIEKFTDHYVWPVHAGL